MNQFLSSVFCHSARTFTNMILSFQNWIFKRREKFGERILEMILAISFWILLQIFCVISWIYSIINMVTIVAILVGTCDLESLVAFGHKKIWRPPATNMGFCDFKYVVAFGNSQLWRPLAAKVKGHHSGLSKKMVSLE